MSLFVIFAVLVHDDVVEQLVADVLLQLEEELHLVRVALVKVSGLLAGQCELLLEADTRAVVLVLLAIFLATGTCETPELKFDRALSQHGRNRASLGRVPLPRLATTLLGRGATFRLLVRAFYVLVVWGVRELVRAIRKHALHTALLFFGFIWRLSVFGHHEQRLLLLQNRSSRLVLGGLFN